MQSKKQSHYEVIINQIIGIAIGWGIVFFIFPLLSSLSQAQLATASSIMFFIASYTRSYMVRRVFNKINKQRGGLT